MSQFKYEIDERNLRLQLRAVEMPFNDEAWQKFETFSASRKSHAGAEIKRFNFSLNRNVILPVVFGTVIVLFSLLLFNFINIKNPNPGGYQRAETKAKPEAMTTEIKKEVKHEVKALPQPVVETPAQEEMKEPAAPAGEVTKPAEQPQEAKTQPVEKNINTETPARAAVAETRSENVGSSNNDNTAKAERPARKRHKKREMVETEAAAGEDDMTPPAPEAAGQ